MYLINRLFPSRSLNSSYRSTGQHRPPAADRFRLTGGRPQTALGQGFLPVRHRRSRHCPSIPGTVLYHLRLGQPAAAAGGLPRACHDLNDRRQQPQPGKSTAVAELSDVQPQSERQT